eukprot:gene4999-8597_t
MSENKQKEEVIPISQRPLDIFIIVLFILFFIIAYLVDIVAAVSPFGSPSNPGVTPDLLKSYWWAPLRDEYARWCVLDPAFCANSPWMRIMAAFSPFLYGPFYIIAIYAFLKGKNWIRPFALCYAWGLFYSLTIIMGEEMLGESAAHDFIAVAAVNSPYWILMPGILAYRFWNTHTPFTRKVKTD